MAKKRPDTQRIKASDARQNWSKLLDRVHVGDLRLVIEKNGIPLAGVVSAADLERLALLEAERERTLSVVDEIRECFSDVPDDQLEQEIERAVAGVREELRAERETLREE